MTEPRTLVIIPTYNEIDNLRPIVARVHTANPGVHVLIVDDASPDGTGDLADTLAAADGRVHVLHRSGKAGLGAAYRAGFGWGLQAGFDILVEMDADGSHRPEQLPTLLAAVTTGGADLALGSRWVPGGDVAGWPLRRQLISRAGSLYARLLLGLPLRDVTGGYRAYRRNVLEGIGYAGVDSQGYCFQIELAWRAVRAGFRAVEVPITFADRQRGTSKMNGAIVREAITRVTRWGLASRRAQLGALGRRG